MTANANRHAHRSAAGLSGLSQRANVRRPDRDSVGKTVRALVAFALFLLFQTPAYAQEDDARRTIAAVRLGGTVLVCRHAKTTSFNEQEPVDYEDESTQRLLSREGEEQSAEIGRAMLEHGIVVSEIVASPMQRARRTAELMLERPVTIDSSWHTNGSTYPEEPRRQRIAMLEAPPASGNRLIVSHIGTMGSVLPLEGRRVREGDCVVVRPTGRDFEFVDVVPFEAWGTSGRS